MEAKPPFAPLHEHAVEHELAGRRFDIYGGRWRLLWPLLDEQRANRARERVGRIVKVLVARQWPLALPDVYMREHRFGSLRTYDPPRVARERQVIVAANL